jgi:hypothetical protein
MNCPVHQIGDVIGCLNGKRMSCGPWPRRNVAGHFPRGLKLAVRPFREDSNHQAFQRDDANSKLDQFGVGQRGNVTRLARYIRRLRIPVALEIKIIVGHLLDLEEDERKRCNQR